jgi:cytochrome bd-type quinol oxidase subunit 2
MMSERSKEVIMSCGKCGSGRSKGLCPVSFGLALGITSALAVFIWSIWIMYYGMPPMMVERHILMPTWSSSSIHALWALLKGFVFGFVFALFYDLFACCFKSMWGKKQEGTCGCGNSHCSCSSKSDKPDQTSQTRQAR